jgi:hypothetical protein
VNHGPVYFQVSHVKGPSEKGLIPNRRQTEKKMFLSLCLCLQKDVSLSLWPSAYQFHASPGTVGTQFLLLPRSEGVTELQ